MNSESQTLCILGCGNLGVSMLKSLLDLPPNSNNLPFTKYIACVRSESSQQSLTTRLASHVESGRLEISRNAPQTADNNRTAVQRSSAVVLAVEPSATFSVLQESRDLLPGKLLISVVAGWSEEKIFTALDGHEKPHIICALPNIAARIAQSVTALVTPESATFPQAQLSLAKAILTPLGPIVQIPPVLLPAATAIGGSTPAFWAILADAMIDASVAVGMPRREATQMIVQSMKGTAMILETENVGTVKEQGTSPEGCTIAGVMVMEEKGVRGAVGRAVRESVSVARMMGGDSGSHVNDTR